METVLKTSQNKCVKRFEYCIIIAKSLVTFLNKIIFLDKRRLYCKYAFQKLILKNITKSSVIPRTLRELETSRSSPHKVNNRWGGCGVQDHYDWILNKSLFKEFATFITSERNATSTYSQYNIYNYYCYFIIKSNKKKVILKLFCFYCSFIKNLFNKDILKCSFFIMNVYFINILYDQGF